MRYHVHDANTSRDYETALRERWTILTLHETRARRRRDSRTLEAVRRGRRRTRELYGYQAVDALRDSIRSRDLGATGRHAALLARLNPSLAVTSAAQAIRSRLPGR